MKVLLFFLGVLVVWVLLVLAVHAYIIINSKMYMRGQKFKDLFKKQK
jgi:hypothetical protein